VSHHLGNDSSSFHPVHSLIRAVGLPDLHHPKGRGQAVPTGRLLKGAMPAGLDRRVAQLVAALAPLADSYPLPHFRVKP